MRATDYLSRNFEQPSGSDDFMRESFKSQRCSSQLAKTQSLSSDSGQQLTPSSDMRLSTSRSASVVLDLARKRQVKIFEELSRMPLSRGNIPSALQLKQQFDRRTLEKCSRQLAKEESKTTVCTRLFSLYKYKVKGGAFNSCMHFYKRDLSPVRETFVMYCVISRGSPYK